MRAPAVVLIALALSSCRALPEIPGGECGNRVLEASEDCDSFAVDGYECRPKDAVGACHFDCSRRADGERDRCPPDFGCDSDEVCRRATGRFDLLSDAVAGNFASLLSGDFDGDGRDDVVGARPEGLFGSTQISVLYFDAFGALEDRWNVSEALANPRVFSAAGADERADLLASGTALAVLFGEPNRTLSPDVRPSYHVPDAEVIVVPVSDEAVADSSALIVLVEHDGKFELHKPADATHLLAKLVDLPGNLANLLGPTTGWLFKNEQHPCWNAVLAQHRSSEVSSFQICERNANGAIRFREQALETRLRLPEGSLVESQPLIADIDCNGHNDLLVASEDELFVAFGDGNQLEPFVPYPLTHYDPKQLNPDFRVDQFPLLPIAAGDLTGDGCADLVEPRALVVSERLPDGSGVGYRVQRVTAELWSEARIGDFTGDLEPDAVMTLGGRPDLDVFVGTGSDRPNHLRIQTSYPARKLTAGDFDGDRIADVAFIQHGSGAGGDDEFLVSFGGSFESLSSPVTAGHVAAAVDLSALSDNRADTTSDLIVMHQLVNDRAESGAALSLLQGNPNRNFISPIQLTSSNIAGELTQGECLNLATGRFQGGEQVGALALASVFPKNDADPYALWLLPRLDFAGSTPRMVGWPYDDRLVPRLEQPNTFPVIAASLEGGDIDGDGVDELLAISPSSSADQCVIEVATIDAEAGSASLDSVIVLDRACAPKPAFRVADIDLDGLGDLVVLLGNAEVPGPILVLWNDPGRGLDARDLAVLVDAIEKPRAFDVYSSSPGGAPRIAHVSEKSAYIQEARRGQRSFRALGRAATLENATGIVAGDVNGDGLVDLAVADSGKIRILRAALAR